MNIIKFSTIVFACFLVGCQQNKLVTPQTSYFNSNDPLSLTIAKKSPGLESSIINKNNELLIDNKCTSKRSRHAIQLVYHKGLLPLKTTIRIHIDNLQDFAINNSNETIKYNILENFQTINGFEEGRKYQMPIVVSDHRWITLMPGVDKENNRYYDLIIGAEFLKQTAIVLENKQYSSPSPITITLSWHGYNNEDN